MGTVVEIASPDGYGDNAKPDFYWDWRKKFMHVGSEVLKCVCFVGNYDKQRDHFSPNGTAFFVGHITDGRYFQQFVTAKHVIDEIAGDRVYLRMNRIAGGFHIVGVDKRQWLFHSDPGKNRVVDVAILPLDINANDIELLHISTQDTVVTDDVIKKMHISIGEDVYLTGLFTTHFGETKNLPVLRCGTIAAMPEEPLWTKWGYMEAYLIELRSIGGLSGSPVWVQFPPFRMINSTIVETTGTIENPVFPQYFLGMISGHYVIENAEDAIVENEISRATDNAPRQETGKINTGLAIVVPAQKILEVIMRPELEKIRKEAVTKMKGKSGFVADSGKAIDVQKVRGVLNGDEILRTMLNTPPQPKISDASGGKKKKAAK